MVPGRAFSRSCSRLQRSSQRRVRSQEALAYSYAAGFSTHSSKAIATSLPRLDWMRMDSSGPIKILRPSIWELKYTPSSLIFRMPARENT